MKIRSLVVLWIAVVFCLPCETQSPRDQQESAVVAWLKANAIPLKYPDDRSQDPSSLDSIFSGKRLVLLGEGTHGTREFFLMKAELARYLIEKHHFKNLGIEYDMVNALPTQDYIQTGRGNAGEALDQQRGWVWNTEEILSLVEWLRKYNEKIDQKVNYVGIDIFAILPSLIHSLEYLKAQQIDETPGVESELKELTGKSIYDFQTSPNGFYSQFSGDPPVEKNYQLKELTRWVVDIFDTNKERLIRQTSTETFDTNRRIAFTAYQGSRHLLQWNMNNIFPTFGRKKQDQLYADAKNVAADLRIFYQQSDPAQSGEVEPALALIESPYRGNRKFQEMSIEDRGKLKDAVMSSISRLEVRRGEYLKHVDQKKLSGIESELRSVLEILEIYRDYLSNPALTTNEREIGLAENVGWLYDTKGKTIIWTHNGHVSKTGTEETDSMGKLLEDRYKEQMLVIGTTFNQGKFQASYSVQQTNADTSQLREFEVGAANKGSLEFLMAQVGNPIFAVDFRKVPAQGPVHDWFSQNEYVRSIGNSYDPANPDNYYEFIKIPDHYDVMIFFDRTTRAEPTPAVVKKYHLPA